MMKKIVMFAGATSLFLFFMVSAAQAQTWADQAEEGKQVMTASKYMMDQAQKLKTVKNLDRAMLVDIAHQLIKHASVDLQNGAMMYADQGCDYTQQVGRKLLSVGGILLKMGRKKGPLTQQEKDEIAKQADSMSELGKMMFQNGQTMGGNL